MKTTHYNHYKLQDWAKNKIKISNPAKAALMDLFNRSEKTILAWIESDNPMLLTKHALEILQAYLRCDEDALIETTPATTEDQDTESCR